MTTKKGRGPVTTDRTETRFTGPDGRVGSIQVPSDNPDAELSWAGDDTRFIPGVPGRHLSGYDLDRLVYRRSAGRRDGTSDGLRPGDEGHAEQRAALVEQLVGSGLYTKAG